LKLRESCCDDDDDDDDDACGGGGCNDDICLSSIIKNVHRTDHPRNEERLVAAEL
jgi:hypothetical protein